MEQQTALYEARAQQLIEIESALPAKISPQELVWLLWKKPEERQEDEQAVVAGPTERIAPLADVVSLVHDFIDMMKHKNAALVSSWMERARGCASGEMQWLARSLTGEQAALEAAVSLPWSNGSVEGVVNKIKLIKRQMYGRAAFTTLRSRILTGFGSLHQS